MMDLEALGLGVHSPSLVLKHISGLDYVKAVSNTKLEGCTEKAEALFLSTLGGLLNLATLFYRQSNTPNSFSFTP